jgi:hypothetical protein
MIFMVRENQIRIIDYGHKACGGGELVVGRGAWKNSKGYANRNLFIPENHSIDSIRGQSR